MMLVVVVFVVRVRRVDVCTSGAPYHSLLACVCNTCTLLLSVASGEGSGGVASRGAEPHAERTNDTTTPSEHATFKRNYSLYSNLEGSCPTRIQNR